jgi:hypothetical protein
MKLKDVWYRTDDPLFQEEVLMINSYKEQIINWLKNNEPVINDLIAARQKDAEQIDDPLFQDEIEEELFDLLLFDVRIELGKALGIAPDVIAETLENSEVTEYLYDCMGFNDFNAK